ARHDPDQGCPRVDTEAAAARLFNGWHDTCCAGYPARGCGKNERLRNAATEIVETGGGQRIDQVLIGLCEAFRRIWRVKHHAGEGKARPGGYAEGEMSI